MSRRINRNIKDVSLPFRWDVSRRERLGSLLEEDKAALSASVSPHYPTSYAGFLDDLLAGAARTVALAGNADLVFVGRSPESLFDLLSGLLRDTSWQTAGNPRLTLLRYSVGYTETALVRRKQPEVLAAFRAYLETLGLSPARLVVRERPVALIDLICGGTTMHELLRLLTEWAAEERADLPAVRRKVRVVGLVSRRDVEDLQPRWKRRREKVGKPWYWRTEAAWVNALLERGALREVSLSPPLWDFLGNYQEKSTPSYTPDDWGSDAASRPCHEPYCLAGLRGARHLYETGSSWTTRERFAALLAAEAVAMREPWCRGLVTELRNRAIRR